jgi:hypothetical protein
MALIGACFLFFQAGCQDKPSTAESAGTAVEASVAEPAAVAEQSPQSPAPAEKAPAAKALPPGAKGSRITFEKVVHDFGDISPGSKNMCEFNFTNTGDSLLMITNVSKSCGCTPYTLAKQQYEAGESGVLKVSFSAASHPGPTKKTLHVSSSDKTNPRIQLTVQANIKPKVSYEPQQLNLVANKENAGSPDIVLKSLDGKAFAIKQIKATGRFQSSQDCITADFDPNVTATEFVLKPKVDIAKLKKTINGNLHITLTHPESASVNIPFRMLSRFQLQPQIISILKVEEGEPLARELWVINNYGEDFEIESTSSKSGNIQVTKQEKVGQRYKLDLEIVPPMQTGNIKTFMDELYVQIKGGEKLTVSCRGFYKQKESQQPESPQQEEEQPASK